MSALDEGTFDSLSSLGSPSTKDVDKSMIPDTARLLARIW